MHYWSAHTVICALRVLCKDLKGPDLSDLQVNLIGFQFLYSKEYRISTISNYHPQQRTIRMISDSYSQ